MWVWVAVFEPAHMCWDMQHVGQCVNGEYVILLILQGGLDVSLHMCVCAGGLPLGRQGYMEPQGLKKEGRIIFAVKLFPLQQC